MAVYLMKAGDTGSVKIGYAVDPSTRLAGCQTGNPLPLSLIRVVDGGRNVERWFHKEFKHLRIRGEWFTFDERMLTVVPVIDPPPIPLPDDDEDPFERYQKFGTYTPRQLEAKAKAAGTSVLALMKALGISYSIFTRWKNGNNSIRLVTYEKIVNALWRFTHEGDG